VHITYQVLIPLSDTDFTPKPSLNILVYHRSNLLHGCYYICIPFHVVSVHFCLFIYNSKTQMHVLFTYACYIYVNHPDCLLLWTYQILHLTTNQLVNRRASSAYLYAYTQFSLPTTTFTKFFQVNKAYNRLYGGGLKPTLNTFTGDPILLERYQQTSPMSIAVNISQQNQWSPRHQFPIHCSNHPIEELLTDQDFQTIQVFARQSQHKKLTYITQSHLTAITTESLQQLISHGEMIIDSVLNVFLEIMCTATSLNYLSTYFISLL